jgi:hypothetical protein
VSAGAVPLADVRPLRRTARRTRAVRIGLALASVGAASVALAASLRTPADAMPLLPPGSDGIVVLDLSASVSASVNRRLAATLDRLANAGGRYGLVLFSDTAYLALPPRTPAVELRSFARFFRVPAQDGGQLEQLPESPWSGQFSAGTQISTGLALALDVIRRDAGSPATVLLVSDLDDAVSDVEPLAAIAVEYRRENVPLRVVALDADPDDRALMTALLARPGDLLVAPDPGAVAGRPATADGRSVTLVVSAAVTAALLALLLAASARVRWKEAT